MAKDIETHEKFIELRAKGHSYQHISEQLNVSKPTLIKWAHFHEVDIKNLRAMHLDSVWQEAKLCAESRIANLGTALQKVAEELAKRDFSEVPSEKLVDVFLKLNDTASKMDNPQTFMNREFRPTGALDVDTFLVEKVERWAV